MPAAIATLVKGYAVATVFAVVAFFGGRELAHIDRAAAPGAAGAFELAAEVALAPPGAPAPAARSAQSPPSPPRPRKVSTPQVPAAAAPPPALAAVAPPPAPAPPTSVAITSVSSLASPPALPPVSVARTSQICSFATALTPARAGVILSEIAWMGTVSSPSDEWVELRNLAAEPFNLSGWQLLDAAEQVRVVFVDGDVIPASGYYLLERTDDESVPGISADKTYEGALGNTAEGLRLFNPSCALVDEAAAAPSWPAGEAGTRRTMERDPEGFGWHTSSAAGGTPRASNSVAANPAPAARYTLGVLLSGSMGTVTSDPEGITCGEDCDEEYQAGTEVRLTAAAAPGARFILWEGDCAGVGACALRMDVARQARAVFEYVGGGSPTPPPPPPPSGSPPPPPTGGAWSNVVHVLISEVQLTGGPGATTNDFIELYNPMSASFNLKGHRLVKRTAQGSSDTTLKAWTEDAFIPSRGFYLWANSSFTSIAVQPDVAMSGSIADNNAIALREGVEDTGVIVDSVGWGAITNGLAEGSPLAGGLEANQSYERRAWQTGSCASSQGSGEALGNGCDTNQNASDFEVRVQSQPQNSSSPPEP